ncbi:hypothetical protein GCM10010145_01700 [Streptomyces ruber]|uniref:HTH gntR-type domain-containing protein n=3 Tax=Streptomyces TaxID=1883 RepID=A0A918EMS7_9ACTN|nr:hypothetical protein GCM10010145_01700 [Streptomyces ruber]
MRYARVEHQAHPSREVADEIGHAISVYASADGRDRGPPRLTTVFHGMPSMLGPPRSRGPPQAVSVRRMSYELDRTRPVWRQVAAAVITRIAEGEYPVGARMPTAVALSTEVDVATSTAQKAMSHLKARGLIRSEVGLGSFVAERPE